MMGWSSAEFNVSKANHQTEGAPEPQAENGERRRALPAAAARALAEAEARRAAEKDCTVKQPVEVGGRGGKDPVRYGDWEVKGRAIDF
jgi:hypothetical protein